MVQVVEILSSWKTRICSYYMENTMVADDLAPQGARSSAAMVLAYNVHQNIPISRIEQR